MSKTKSPKPLAELSADFQMRLNQMRKKEAGGDKSKMPTGKKMVFGKVQDVGKDGGARKPGDRKSGWFKKHEELARELKRLESLSTPFPEARERRIAAVREELAKLGD